MVPELIPPALILASALALIALERWFPYDRGQRFLRDGWFTDLFWYGLVQGYAIVFLVKRAVQPAAPGIHLVSGWPLPAQFAFFVVLHDLYIYWFHRWQHHSPTLWRLHEIHHATPHVDWIATARRHALELFVNQLVAWAPLVLLGADAGVVLAVATIDSVWGMYIHANLDVRSGWLQYVINGPEMHRFHHSSESEQQTNFSSKLAIWDWLFGTAYLPRGEKPAAYGLWGGPRFPAGYLAQNLHAFRVTAPAVPPSPAVSTRRAQSSGSP